ncbi:hypothetical protein D1B33_10085 [Lysinibacillus yapensis]|uniref:Uncharacterized protein n=1 Tax=Ureibacillus yapensis TaxID=2304605 RepID=A0A396SDS4_9BACL|nr:hypothetical protein [Lysinibacillus yapensis]RHW36734.1 hypothetical protein D1B33_10085 [Lysinibacillus yapensis]
MRKILSLIVMLLVFGLGFSIFNDTTIATESTKINKDANNAANLRAQPKVDAATAISKKKPKAAPTTITGGLTPKEGLVLTYSPSFLDDQKETFYVEKDGESTYLYNPKSPHYPHMPNYTYIEDKKRLLVGVANSDVLFLSASYPLKQGKHTKDPWSENKLLIESTAKTLKVKAGTFKNVVVFRYPDGSRAYLAKDIGIIKGTDKNGNTTMELISVKEEK